MEKAIPTIIILLFPLFVLAQPPLPSIEPSGKQFVVVNRSAPIDSAQARAMVVEQSKGLARQIAELQLRISALQKQKDKLDAQFTAVGGAVLEEAVSGPVENSIVGEYAFTLGGKADKLTIEKKGGQKRLAARLDSGGKGAVKIEADGVALLIGVFADAKKAPFDVKISQQGSQSWVGEIAGEVVTFTKQAAQIPSPPKK